MYYDLEDKAWRCEIWAQNWPAMQFFSEYMRTQWREGFGGKTGLDYNVLLHELDRRNLSCDEYDDLFGCIRLIEQTALQEMRKD